MADRRPFTITNLRQTDGYWQARVTAGGAGFDVDRKHGSWQLVIGKHRHDVKPDVAAALQAKVVPLERAAKRTAAEADALEDAA